MLNDTFPLRVEAIPAAHASEWRADDSFPPSETQAWQLVFVRSGMGFQHGIGLSNGVGVIDSDYRGEISVGLMNLSGEDYTIRPGDRIAQLMVVPVVRPELVQVDALDETERGAGGFGSTGR